MILYHILLSIVLCSLGNRLTLCTYDSLVMQHQLLKQCVTGDVLLYVVFVMQHQLLKQCVTGDVLLYVVFVMQHQLL